MEQVQAIVIGAGVVGLAIARRLALDGQEVLLLESEKTIGSITSSRNSGVLHAGLYYRPGGLKARLCVAGQRQLYAYAEERGLPFQRCGKLVVATSEDQVESLHKLKKTAEQNGVFNLRMLTPEEARQFEPEVFCHAAMLSPGTGIIDVHPLMLSLLGDAEAAGTTLALQAPFAGAKISDRGFVVDIGGAVPMSVACRTLINAAGLGAQTVAHHIAGLDGSTIPGQVLAKGSYFSFSGRAPFRMLIYPMPVPGSSGLHATFDLSGQVRFGPDVEWVEAISYQVDPTRRPLFEEAIRQYWPSLPEGVLQPDYCGIRPKLVRGSPHDSDFVIHASGDHGVEGLVNLYGIESPGLTSSLALADHVAELLA